MGGRVNRASNPGSVRIDRQGSREEKLQETTVNVKSVGIDFHCRAGRVPSQARQSH